VQKLHFPEGFIISVIVTAGTPVFVHLVIDQSARPHSENGGRFPSARRLA
jgi:hypothetical protein